ncbi:MAG TPA: methyltransferase [Solirubrobacteraceae bacterium]|nr:methyltransferase [Solirubrobacteraceae bacterium]
MDGCNGVIEEFDGLRLVCDPEDTQRPDVVQGVTSAARTLAGLLVPRPVRTALDLGTGCGVLALTMARRAERVVATDVNPRALEFARRSAHLSGIANVQWRQGDWYAPVRGQRFELIACNPPYVVSPETRLLFRDGSQATESVVRTAAQHLVAGGLAQFLVNWVHEPDDWTTPLRDWIPPGCDALVVHHATMRPGQYAETWVPAGPDHDARAARWLAWYREHNIEAIGAAFLCLRRREDDGPPRLQALEASTRPTPRAGLHVERLLRGTDLAAGGDEALRAATLAIVDGVRAEHTTRRRAGGWQPGPATLRVVPTVGVHTDVPADLLAVLWGLDGTRPLSAVLADLTGATRADGLALARRLVELGFAEPAAG